MFQFCSGCATWAWLGGRWAATAAPELYHEADDWTVPVID
jgi:hypothetical protein